MPQSCWKFLAPVLLTIAFYGFTACQFIPLSSSDIFNNHINSVETVESMMECNIASWYSSYYQKNVFMLSYFDWILVHNDECTECDAYQIPLLTSNLLSFSTNYSYHLYKSFNISEHAINMEMMEIVLSSSSIMVLSQASDKSGQYLLYHIISNLQRTPIQNISISPIKIWQTPSDVASDTWSDQGSGHAGLVTASKLYGSDLFIIVYENYNSLLRYMVNETTPYFLSSPKPLISQIDSSVSDECDDCAFVNGIKVRASKTTEMYLIVWSADYYLDDDFYMCDHVVRASLYKNDGSVVNSMIDIATKTTVSTHYLYMLYDVIAFNISVETGFYAILYYDMWLNRLCVRILDDLASDLVGNDTITNVRNKGMGNLVPVSSATIRALDLVSPPRTSHKLYFVVSWSATETFRSDGAVYIQMFEFSWAPSMEPYHLYPVDDPFKVFSTETDRLRKHGMDSVGNQLLVCMDSEYSRKIYTQLLTTTITENPTAAPSKYPSSAPTKHPSDPTVVPTNTPSKAPVTTNKPTNAPTNNPTNSTKEPSRAPIGSEKIIVQKENKKQYLLLLITIPFIIFCAYRMKQYMSFVIVDKALILIIGICEFSGDQLSDLPGIESNVDDLRRLWFDTYRYTVKVCNESTLKCTKRDILRFIDKYKHLLEDASYKAVIVHILSHGSGDDSFMTSDLKTMQTSFVEHELITTTEFAGHPEVIKLIFHHACRGHADYFEAQQIERGSNKFSNKFSLELKEIRSNRECNQNKAGHVPLRSDSSLLFHRKQRKEADAHSNCAVLYGTIEDRALSDDGHFTESICQVFGANSRNLIKRDLYGLIRQIGDDLEDRTHSAQICTSKGIGTLRNKIRFENCTKKMQYWETI
eukprot:232311_1